MNWIEIDQKLININRVTSIIKLDSDLGYSNALSNQDIRYRLIFYFEGEDRIEIDYKRDRIARDNKFNQLKDKLC